ncbi:MAG: protein kinase domain-containing protein [Syntrophobacteria bacterium]
MQSENTTQRSVSELPEIQEKLNEAELYRGQGLFAEARQIYQKLLESLADLPEAAGGSAAQSSSINRAYLQEQLALVDREEAEFLGEPAPDAPQEKPPPAREENEGAALFNRGLALLDIGLFAEAIQEFQLAAGFDYEPFECSLEIGKAHMQMGQYRESIKVLEEAYRREHLSSSHRNRLLEQMAIAYEGALDKTKALELYRELAASDPHHPTAADRVESLSRESRRYHINLAKLHLGNKQFLKAIEQLRLLQHEYHVAAEKLVPAYRQILRKDPENIDALRNLTEIFLGQNDLPQAAEHLEKIQQIRPQDTCSQQHLTDVYRQMLDKGTGGPETRLKLAHHLVRARQLDSAISEYMEVILEDSNYKLPALIQLGEVLLQQQDYDRILEFLGDALPWVESLEQAPEILRYYYLLGTACEKKYLYERAQTYFDRAAAIDPTDEAICAKWAAQAEGPLISIGKAMLRLQVDEKLEYQIQEKIGQDEIHAIFKLREATSGTVCTGKTLLPHLPGGDKVKEFILRWTYEQTTMENRNIVRVLDVAERQGQYYLVMEDFQTTLEEVLREKTYLPLAEGVTLGRALLNAMAYAHSHRGTDDTLRKVFHLALDPRRVLIKGNAAAAKVADFGLASFLATILDWAPDYHQRSVFELTYMAPEQFDRSPARMPAKMKQAADLYTFGVIFYQILTGKVPFKGPSPEDFKRQHAEKYPVPPRVYISSIPAKLDEAILKCLHKDPKKRWRTPTELDLALEKIDISS